MVDAMLANLLNKNKQPPKQVIQKEMGKYTKYLISKNSLFIIENTIEEIKDFSQTSFEKQHSLNIFKNLIEACGNTLSKYSEKVLFALYKNADHEDETVRKLVKEVAEIVGKNFDQEILIPTVLRHLQDSEIKNSNMFCACLSVFSALLKKIINISFSSTKLIIETMRGMDIFNSCFNTEKVFKDVIMYTHEIYTNIVNNLYSEFKLVNSSNLDSNLNSVSNNNIDSYNGSYSNNSNLGTNKKSDLETILKTYHSDIFYSLLLLQSIPILPINNRKEIENHFKIFAEMFNLESIADLYNLELLFVLEKFKSTHNEWRRNTADRFAFDTYVKNAGEFLNFDSGENWIRILEIISDCCDANKDIEMRMDMIILIDSLITTAGSYSTDSSLAFFTEFIIEQILLPAAVWRAKRPNTTVRKGALICLLKLYQYNLVELSITVKYFKQYVTVLKSSLEDDWDCELRNISIKVLNQLFTSNFQNNYKSCFIGEEELREVYPLLIKRMDDSQDENRKAVCLVFTQFFTVIKDRVKISDSTVEYILQATFIHLDDNKSEIRKHVYDFLAVFASIEKESYRKIIKNILDEESLRFTNKDYLDSLKNIVFNIDK